MTIKIYRDDNAQSIFLEDANGAQFPNSLQAILNGEDNTKVSIVDLAKSIEIVSDELFGEFINENDQAYGNDGPSTVNALNAEFMASGTPANELPVITSPTSINAVSGETINYTLTANFGVGYEWENLPTGLVTVEGNTRKLIGSLSSGTYTPTMRAVNYNGVDSETLTINVSNPPFANTKSINFVINDYLSASPLTLATVLGRAANGSGASDAWSLSLYFKSGSSFNSEQTIFYFGDSNYFSNGTIRLAYNGYQDRVELLYGNLFNNLEIRSQNGSIPFNQWVHILVTYNGGTTGAASGSVNDYYSRFKIFINGVEATYNNSNSNFGYSGAVQASNLRIGRYAQGDYMRNNCRVDEVAVFDSDQSLNAALIYNLGVPFDMTTLLQQPVSWWRMGDGDTYPLLVDNIGSADFTMVNMTAADIVNDVP